MNSEVSVSLNDVGGYCGPRLPAGDSARRQRQAGYRALCRAGLSIFTEMRLLGMFTFSREEKVNSVAGRVEDGQVPNLMQKEP